MLLGDGSPLVVAGGGGGGQPFGVAEFLPAFCHASLTTAGQTSVPGCAGGVDGAGGFSGFSAGGNLQCMCGGGGLYGSNLDDNGDGPRSALLGGWGS